MGKGIVSSMARSLFAKIKERFVEEFMKNHIRILPISKKKLKEYCQQNGSDWTKYKILKNSNLLYNACLSPSCPHYLKIGSMLKHLSTWKTKCPKGFHLTVKKFFKKSAQEIFKKFIEQLDQPLEYFGLEKEDILDYIETLRGCYNQIKEDDG